MQNAVTLKYAGKHWWSAETEESGKLIIKGAFSDRDKVSAGKRSGIP